MSYMDQPLVMKRLALKNRLVLPPMASGLADPEGEVTDEVIRHYVQLARGGFLGLIITEHHFIAPEGKARPGQLSLADDGKIEGLARLTKAVHAEGCPVIAQISHAGCALREPHPGLPVLSPSGIPFGNSQTESRSMTADEIRTVIRQFAQAARRAREAGYDGVEIHSAHGYLLNQFASPLTNHRDDEYGGSVEGRLRIHRDIIAAVREEAGDDFPILVRLGACDYMDGGNTFTDGIRMAEILAQTDIDALDISGGLSGYRIPGREGMQGYFSDISTAIRAKVSLPVILTGGVTEIHAAEQLLQEGAADLIGVGRAMLKDPLWAKKAFEELAGEG